MSQYALRCSVFRGGTSKGLYFHADDLPADFGRRDAILLAAMGSPDPRQIDGMGGGTSLTSKVAVVGPSQRPGIDIDYNFLQIWPDQGTVSASQTCGNLLAGVGPFAIEEGLVEAHDHSTVVRIWLSNVNRGVVEEVQTRQGQVLYSGTTAIDGVPGAHSPVIIDFAGDPGQGVFPTGSEIDRIRGISVSCIDAGMPVVCVAAKDLNLSGAEDPQTLEADAALVATVEAIRMDAGRLMGLGNVQFETIPKVSIVSAPLSGGTIRAQTFILPGRVHNSIGVFGALSVAVASLARNTIVQQALSRGRMPSGGLIRIEHPGGSMRLDVEYDERQRRLVRGKFARTARLLMRGEVFVPASLAP